MKKKILSVLLALCMVVCLLPMTALADAESATIVVYDAANNPLPKTAQQGGEALYFYTNENGLVVDAIAGTSASEADYNIKFVYPADGEPTVYLKDAAINHTTRFGLDIGGVDAATADAENFTVIIESDSTIASQGTYTAAMVVNTTGDVTFTSVNKAKLTVQVSGKAPAVSALKGGDLKFLNANVKVEQSGSDHKYAGILLAGDLTVEGGKLEITSTSPSIWLSERTLMGGAMQNTSGTPRNITVKNGTLIANVTGTSNYQNAIGFDGTFTVDNANVTVTRAVGGKCLSVAPTIIGDHTVTGRPTADDIVPYVIEHNHVPGEDDHNCTTGTLCICGYEFGTGNAAHTPAEDDGDCTTDILCANPGCEQVVTAGNAAHAPEADDDDCTTAVKCTNPGCEADAIAAKDHEPVDGEFSCSEAVACKNCSKNAREAGEHFGGTATCKDKAVCSSCGQEYGEKGTHAGGTATCKDKAICATCGEAYGELAACTPAADDGDCTTAVKCSVCGKETTAAKTHTYTDNKDASCNNTGCTHTRTIEGTENPKTADATALVPLFVLLAVSVFGLAIVLNKKKVTE